MRMYLVTGGMGFIGSNLVNSLSKNNKVTIVDDLSSGFFKNVKKNKNIKFIKKKIQEIKTLKKVDGIFHLCAQPSVPISVAKTYESSKNNILSSLKIFDFAKKHNIPIVFSSSSAIYGNISVGDDRSDHTDILTPYSLDKLHLEFLSKIYFKLFKVRSIGLRFFNVYGPNQDEKNPYSGVISKFIMQAKRDSAITIYGGLQTRDFIYVDDVVKICKKFMKILFRQKVNEIYNVGTGREVSINYLYKLICKKFNKKFKKIKTNLPLGDPKRSKGNFIKIRRKLKFFSSEFCKFEEGLDKTIEFYNEKNI